MIFDTHAHYDDEAFDIDRNELLSGMKNSGIERIVNIGADLKSCKTTLALSGEYDFIYAALGVHPSGVGELNEEKFRWLAKVCKDNSLKSGGKVVAIGETGLDYNFGEWNTCDEKEQKLWFERHIELAKELHLPLVVHSRDAAKDTYDVMKACNAGEAGGIVHCYAYSKEMAGDFLNMGFYFGIGGVVTFKNAKKLKEVVEYLPMDRIVLETDCPYLSPEPYRGKRNNSLNLQFVAAKIAELKALTKEEVIQITGENAYRVYGMTE